MKRYVLFTQLCITLACVFLVHQSCAFAGDAEYFDLSLHDTLRPLSNAHPSKSGAYVFEKGEEALLARAWLTDHGVQTIDVQYFIWSTDNIGILAAEALLRAAERGVKVRALVDDLLIDAPDKVMLALNAHPNVEIRIYNPKHTVGTTVLGRLFNLAFSFRSFNQRMHDKTFTVDGAVSITGGRNMADEYFDYDHTYNFRDRDILLIGPVVEDVQLNFDTFWNSRLVTPVEKLLNYKSHTVSLKECERIYTELHAYALDPINFEPKVHMALYNLHHKFTLLEEKLIWDDITFTNDLPGKNSSGSLSGSGDTTKALIEVLSQAKESVIIQSPYLIMPPGGVEFFKKLNQRGVEVKISTNSLASTDNLQAFSGYFKQRSDILAAGVQVFEFRPDPAIQQELIDRYESLQQALPTFAIHAKSMVIDHEVVFIGTFNLDPRSANLNTEVGVLIKNRALALQIEESILQDMLPENSWNASTDNPDSHASLVKKLKIYLWSLLPLNPIL